MEKKRDDASFDMLRTTASKKKGNNIKKGVEVNYFFEDSLTEVNLSNLLLSEFNAKTSFPKNLKTLNLSGNKFTDVPECVARLRYLLNLDLSSNKIKSFDKQPGFCHSIVNLNIANNSLISPPCWIWTKSPKCLTTLILNNNVLIANTLLTEIFMKNDSMVTLEINNCKLNSKHTDIFISFPNLQNLVLGSENFNRLFINDIESFPFQSIKECWNLQTLSLVNTLLYEIKTDIKNFKNLKEIDLSQNYLSCLPNEFCELANLITCDLSCNNIQYLPEDIKKLSKLEILIVNNNKLYTVPDDLTMLPLKRLDLYDNELYEVPNGIFNIKEIDVAQNYVLEPDDEDYMERREVIRLLSPWRKNGSKNSNSISEDPDHDTTDDEESFVPESLPENVLDRESTSSDWDSDDYWVPHYIPAYSPIPTETRFACYVKKKMEEGNFCPADIHPESISEMIKNKKKFNSIPFYESDGQFDDYSSDES